MTYRSVPLPAHRSVCRPDKPARRTAAAHYYLFLRSRSAVKSFPERKVWRVFSLWYPLRTNCGNKHLQQAQVFKCVGYSLQYACWLADKPANATFFTPFGTLIHVLLSVFSCTLMCDFFLVSPDN